MTSITCPFCERRCNLTEEGGGFCHMYHVAGGTVVERFPHRYSSTVVSHIEAIPFYHFQPGSRSYVLGGAGCNFDCHYCSNAYVARCDPQPLLTLDLPPERVVRFARQAGCHNVTFAVNEPTVALPTLLALAPVARAAGLPVGVLTNGYVPADVAAQMGEAFDFVNVSLKAMDDAFYRQYAGLSADSPTEVVKRTIGTLFQRTHLEVSTPIVQGLNDGDIPAIADFLASVSPEIPWHVFRLLPEYKMADRQRPPIESVNAALEQAREKLSYVYYGNFVGSQWVSTLCPQCGAVAIERINLGGCGAKPLTYRLADNRCAACGDPLPIAGEPVTWNSRERAPIPSPEPGDRAVPTSDHPARAPDVALIDVVDWQTTVDFRTGRPVQVDHPLVDVAAEVLQAHPYPGDLTGAGDRWVTDTGLDLNARYEPDLMMLVYANLFFPAVFSPLDEGERAAQIEHTFGEIERFLDGSGFTPVIVGLGDFVPFQGYVTLTDLDGEVISGGMNPRYAGVNGATPEDLERLVERQGIARIVDRDAFRTQFGGCQRFYDRFPDTLVVAEEGRVFRGPSSSARPLYQVPRYDRALPLHTGLGAAEAITDVAELTLRAAEGERVVLILVEGVGRETFPLPFQPISNALHWHTYSVGDSQYLALTTGQHFVAHPYPPGYRYYVDDGEDKAFPFSAIFTEMPPGTLGARFAGRSAAVGGRGILTHAVAGMDVTVECFVRALYNHGVMAVLAS